MDSQRGVVFSKSDIPDWAYSSTASILEALRSVDPMTYAHCLRVGEYSYRLARAVGLSEFEQRLAEFAGILHDVGKMGVPTGIIHKPAILTPDEMIVVASHPIMSEEIVRPLAHDDFFKQVLPAVRGHHERIDGKGYPDGLKADKIPLLARLILVVDTLDAMGQDRSYRKGMPLEKIFMELQRCAGTQFDTQLVDTFLKSHKFWAKEETHKDSFQRWLGSAMAPLPLAKAA